MKNPVASKNKICVQLSQAQIEECLQGIQMVKSSSSHALAENHFLTDKRPHARLIQFRLCKHFSTEYLSEQEVLCL